MHLWLMAQGPGGDLLPSSCELPAHVPAPCDAGPCARLVWPAQPALASCQTQRVRSILHTIVLLGMLGLPVHCLCSSTALCAVLQPSPALHITHRACWHPPACSCLLDLPENAACPACWHGAACTLSPALQPSVRLWLPGHRPEGGSLPVQAATWSTSSGQQHAGCTA